MLIRNFAFFSLSLIVNICLIRFKENKKAPQVFMRGLVSYEFITYSKLH